VHTNKTSVFFLLLNGLLIIARRSWDSSGDSEAESGEIGSPIPCHSHNDYWRLQPLFSALRAGCVGVEADVWLSGSDLLVGHDRNSLDPSRTLTSLYIEPLRKILEQRNQFSNGTYRGVFNMSSSQTLVLLIDLKTSAESTWPVVLQQLTPLRKAGWLSHLRNGTIVCRPITVVGTGNTRFNQFPGILAYNDAFFDAPLDQLENSPFDSTNSYYASVSFKNSVGRTSSGHLSVIQFAQLREQVKQAHSRGLKVRYWELPAWPISARNHVWEVLVREGVDILNVDDVRGAREFFSRGAPNKK
jgi:hypothetical protein